MNQGGSAPAVEESNKNKCWKILFLKKWHPQPTVQGTKYLFFFMGLVFIIFGVIINIFNVRIKEHSIIHYEDQCPTIGSECKIYFTLEEDFNDTVYLFYGLENFYQNHRRYIKSKSSSQLSGNYISESDATTYCSPIVRNSDVGKTMSIMNTTLVQSDIAYPCGLIARSVFTDSYKLNHYNSQTKTVGDPVGINEKGIAWPDDIGNKFRLDQSQKAKYWTDVEDEHFIVWMRTSGLPNFRKLWGIIGENLKQGSYQLVVKNNYPVSDFKGHKNIILSTSGPFGGKNYFLSVSFIVVGFISVLIALAFFIKQRTTDNRFGNARHQD